MTKQELIKFYQNKGVRSVWDDQREEWYFSVVDIVAILTESSDYQTARNYWKVLKNRLSKEGNETVTNCNRLKLTAADGKKRLTDVADLQGIFRLIQSIPSPKAEPFKMWLAQVGKERIDEVIDPELAIDRALESYLKKGYSQSWINQRLKSIEVRKDLTDQWDKHGVKKGLEYALLTDEITKAWSGMKTRDYKKFKGLKKQNLRDNMTNMELVLNMLAELTTTELTKHENPQDFDANAKIAKRGGTVAGNARKEIESQTGKSVLSRANSNKLPELMTEVINFDQE